VGVVSINGCTGSYEGTGGDRVGASRKAKLKLALVDSRTLIREALCSLLRAAISEYEVRAFETATCMQDYRPVALTLLAVGTASVRNARVADHIDLIKEILPEAPLLVISDRDDFDEVKAALERGVRGFIPTNVNPGVAVGALRLVHSGGTYVPTTAVGLDFAVVRDASAPASPPKDSASGPRLPRDGIDSISWRQRDVLELLCRGLPNKLIADRLGMQESTVKVHVHKIMKKLHVTNRTELAVRAMSDLS